MPGRAGIGENHLFDDRFMRRSTGHWTERVRRFRAEIVLKSRIGACVGLKEAITQRHTDIGSSHRHLWRSMLVLA
jgi:hypothetical protein